MGSLRRGLIATFVLMPSSAWAEVCDKMRPNWVPGTDATVWTEMIGLFSSVPSIALLIATALVVRFRSAWGGVVVTVLWTGLISLLVFSAPDEARLQAVKEGCIGSPTLFIGVVAAICVAMILYTAPRAERADKREK